jgi:glycosyltransferase involved in cell wall biosynthesis
MEAGMADGDPGRGLSLIVPAFNEADAIAQAIVEADAAIRAAFAEYEILVVDDGSSDRTVAVVESRLSPFPKTRLLRHFENRGYGAALRTGFEAARFDLIAFTDADCQFDLGDLAELAELAEKIPIVVGYRADRKDTWRRRFLSRGYNRLVRLLLDTRVRDVDCALKVFRREVLAELLPTSHGFFVNTEMLARAAQLGYDVAELPVTHRPRFGGASKVSLWEVPKTLRVLLGFWWREVVWGSHSRPSPEVILQTRVPVTARLPTSRPARRQSV